MHHESENTPSTPLLELAKRGDANLEAAFAQAAADPKRHDEMLETLRFLVGRQQRDQAELLAWGWLSEGRSRLSPADALDLGRRLLLMLPDSAQLRGDTVELYRATCADRGDIDGWLAATGLSGSKVSPQRACRALDLVLGLKPGSVLAERTSQPSPNLHEHRLIEIVALDASAGTVAFRPLGGQERSAEALRIGDEYEPAGDDDFRVLARRDPQRLKSLLDRDPLTVLLSIMRAAGGQIDAEQLKDNLSPAVLSPADYAKWWSRARTAARKSPHVRIEGRSPAVLVYDPVGTTIEEETLETLAKTWEPPARLAVIDKCLRAKQADGQPPDAAFLAKVAARVDKWLSDPGAGLADALVALRLAELGVPVAPAVLDRAIALLGNAPDPAGPISNLDESLWPIALTLLPRVRPVQADGPGPDDWQAIYLRLLPRASSSLADTIAAALIEAGQIDRLNAEIIAIVESPAESADALAWLWTGPAQADRLQMPRSSELLDQLFDLAKHAEAVAASDPPTARRLRATVRAALSARGCAPFRAHVQSLPEELAPLLRRQIRRAEGLGVTLPEHLLAILDEQHPPVIEARPTAAPWQREDVIFVSSQALAAKEKELEHITHVEMPANARAIGKAASYGDLSENSEYKFALEERDLLRARVARIQQELAQARVITPQEVPTDHVSIYAQVRLAPVSGGEPVTVQVVSPWDSSVAERRYNYKAPICQQLLGKQVGQTARIGLDGGDEVEYRIETIRAPER